jgi:thiopeptide-type bacteriocin biosynthesis protein
MQQAQRFLSLHIFYNVVESRPLLVECIDPLVCELQRRDLIDRYFFIRYWLGGTHVRLRLRPAYAGAEGSIRSLSEDAIHSFLKRRPSFFAIDPDKCQPYMRQLFEAEYGKLEFQLKYGVEGRVPIYPNNSIQYIDYEPEYDRYGGPRGVDLAETHFQFSSSMVLKILRDTNSHIRSALLGQAMQLMLNMARAFSPDSNALATFCRRYSDAWRRDYLQQDGSEDEAYENAYRRQKRKLISYLSRGEMADSGDRIDHRLLCDWYSHCVDIRNAASTLYSKGELLLEPKAQSEEEAITRVFIGYMHMTNNRLGARIVDESYLAYVLSRAVEETACLPITA